MGSKRNPKGVGLAETAAAMVVFVPAIMAVFFVILECARAYSIKESLSEGAREAARNLAAIYAQNPLVASSRAQADLLVFDHVRIKNVINSSSQFANPVWNTTASPPTVFVSVQYTSAQNGLPPFPDPDPLHLGANYQLNGNSTYRLE